MKGIVYLIILVILVGVGFFLFYDNSSVQTNNLNSEQLSTCANIIDEAEKQSCFTQLAIENEDYSMCGNINDEIGKGYCEVDVAGIKGDLSYCQTQAREGQRDVCYQKVAIGKLDESKCELMDIRTRQNAQGTYTLCYSEIAKIKKSGFVCENIATTFVDETTKNTAFDTCYLGAAIGSRDKSICDKIISSINKNYCYSQVS